MTSTVDEQIWQLELTPISTPSIPPRNFDCAGYDNFVMIVKLTGLLSLSCDPVCMGSSSLHMVPMDSGEGPARIPCVSEDFRNRSRDWMSVSWSCLVLQDVSLLLVLCLVSSHFEFVLMFFTAQISPTLSGALSHPVFFLTSSLMLSSLFIISDRGASKP